MKKSRSKRNPPKRPPPPERPKKRKKKHARTRLRTFVKYSFVFGTCALIGLAALGLHIDKRVRARLAQGNAITSSGIYTTTIRYRVDSPIDITQLRKELIDRGYVTGPNAPRNPGEFIISNNTLEILTQAFTDERAQSHQSQLLKIDLSHGKINSIKAAASNSPPKELALEPRLITPLGDEELRLSSYRKIDNLPLILQQAFLAVEDQRFYSHYGIDPLGVVRAIYSNLRATELIQGGSTITQQLAKNLFFSSERSLWRKIGEALAAISLEYHLSKPEILERYLNEVYLGREGNSALHGVAVATRSFFGKDLSDLSLPEAALLAGLVKAPSFYAPRKHPDRAVERRNIVLRAMLDEGYIKQAQFNSAVQTKLKLAPSKSSSRVAPFFVAALAQAIDQSNGEEVGDFSGMRVYTGLTPDIQRCAEEALTHGVADLERRYPSIKRRPRLEGALVAIEPFSGLIKAWVGGRNFGANQFDHVSLGRRQSGSTIKPFLYLTALESRQAGKSRYTPISILLDQPITLRTGNRSTWSPDDYDHEYRGAVTLRYALERSLNLPAAHLVQQLGVEPVARTIERFHIAEKVPRVPAIALGAVDTSLLKMTAAYAALANGGVYVLPRLFARINVANDEELLHSDFIEERVAAEPPTFIVVNLMRGVIERGTANIIRRMGFVAPSAGKTGTSDEARDAWFIGFTPGLAVGVWIGFDDNAKLGLTGGTAAAPIWAEFMKCVSPVPLNFVKPAGIVEVSIDAHSGLRASEQCPASERITELFVAGSEPIGSCGALDSSAETPTRSADQDETTPPNRDQPPPAWQAEEASVWDRLFSH